MKSTKQIGIWMDHSTANLIELSNDIIVITTLKISPVFLGTFENLRLKNSQLQNMEQSHQSDFYKKLSYIINDYNEVLLFGSTNAKTELFNLLKENPHFDNIKIEVKSTDKMTENQQEAFVKKYFEMEV